MTQLRNRAANLTGSHCIRVAPHRTADAEDVKYGQVPAPHIPTPLEQLGNRPFSFYPAIRNIQHNEWQLRRAQPDEIQVMNTKSQQEVWIPRGFLSGVSSIEEPFVIVGLFKELEYREGIVVPHVRRVIQMPLAANDIPRPWLNPPPESGQLAPVVGIRVEGTPESQKSRKMLVAVAAGILTCVVGMVIFRDATAGTRARFLRPVTRLALPFRANDDYESVVSRIGYPESSRSRPAPDGRAFYLLRYPDRAFTLVLLGGDRIHALYIGAFGRGGRVIHSVTLSDGHDSTALLTHMR
jgi:hypothetical protein